MIPRFASSREIYDNTAYRSVSTRPQIHFGYCRKFSHNICIACQSTKMTEGKLSSEKWRRWKTLIRLDSIPYITVASFERHSVWNYWHIGCLFKRYFWQKYTPHWPLPNIFLNLLFPPLLGLIISVNGEGYVFIAAACLFVY